jgi:hypothetical protein
MTDLIAQWRVTKIAVLVAALAVATGAGIVTKAFLAHAFVRSEGDARLVQGDPASDLEVRWAETRSGYADIRVMVKHGYLAGGALSLLVLVFASVVVGMGGARVAQARLYATRMQSWREGTLKPGGRITVDDDETLAMLDASVDSRVPLGPVLVDPGALAPSEAFREARLLGADDVGVGPHGIWCAQTVRRLREARVLAGLGALTVGLTLAAHLLRV